MELELKHLAPYLPYGLNCKILDYKCDYVGEQYNTIKGYYFIGDSVHYNFKHGKDFAGKNTNDFKPILRPLSDLYLNVTGGLIMEKLNCELKNVHEIWDLASGDKQLESISIGTYEVMCINHIDFNRLIDKGLAIDINTLK